MWRPPSSACAPRRSGRQPQDHAAADGDAAAASAGAPAGTPPRSSSSRPIPTPIYVPDLQPELGLWIVALSRLSAVLLSADRLRLGRRGGWVDRLELRPGLRGRRRLVRRLALGRWLGRRLGLGRLGRLGPRQQLHHGQRQPRDLHQPTTSTATTIDDGHWNHDPAHRDGVPYRDRASRERYDQHHRPMPPSARRSAANSTTTAPASAATTATAAPRDAAASNRGQRAAAQRQPRRRRPARRIARQRLARQREPRRRAPQRLPRRRPWQRGRIARPTADTPTRAMRSYHRERRWTTAAVAMAADMEAGDERHDASARPAGARSRWPALADRAMAQQAAKTPGLPDRRGGGERAHRGGAQGRRQGDRGDAGRTGWRDFVPDRERRFRRASAPLYLAAWDEQPQGHDRSGDARPSSRSARPAGPCRFPSSRTARNGASTSTPASTRWCAREIGRDELGAIQTLLAIVDAQRDYAAIDPMKTGAPVYARRLLSLAGQEGRALLADRARRAARARWAQQVANAQPDGKSPGRPLRLQFPPALRPGTGGAGRRARLSS